MKLAKKIPLSSKVKILFKMWLMCLQTHTEPLTDSFESVSSGWETLNVKCNSISEKSERWQDSTIVPISLALVFRSGLRYGAGRRRVLLQQK